MKSNIYNFPLLTGNLSIADKNSVICTVNEKGNTNVQSMKNKFTLIPHKNIIFLRGIEYLIFGTYYFFKGMTKSFKDINKNLNNNQNNSLNNQTLNNNVLNQKNSKFELNNKINKTTNKTNELKKNKDNNMKINTITNSTKKINSYFFISILSILSVLIGIVILGVLPTYLGFWISGSNYSLFVKKLCIGLTKCLVLYLILIAFYFIPAINNFYKFNSSGNLVLNKKDDILKYHRATNYFNFMVFSLLISYFVVSLIGLNISPWLKPFANLGITLLCFALCYELLLLLDTKWIKYKQITMFTSWLVNSKPNQTELQTARVALCEVSLMQNNEQREIINTNKNGVVAFSFVYAESKDKFLNAGINDKSELDWLLSIYLNIPKLQLKFISTITDAQYKDIIKLVERRVKGEPIAKIFGFTEFYGLRFKVNKNVLTPRQETELLVENALKIIDDKKLNVLDLCTGSGAIAIAIAKNSNAKVSGSDISVKAIEIAKQNAELLKVNVNFIVSNLFVNIKKKKFYDVIVSNPPYIKTEDIKNLQKEVKDFDPLISLDGGIDGLYFYKKIAVEAPLYLKKGGILLLEIGFNQSKQVKKLLTEHFTNIKILKDYNNINRIIIAEKL